MAKRLIYPIEYFADITFMRIDELDKNEQVLVGIFSGNVVGINFVWVVGVIVGIVVGFFSVIVVGILIVVGISI